MNLLPITYANNNLSFCAMKKKEFSGTDFAVVEKFKAPIEKFNSNSDLQNWAMLNYEALLNKNYSGRSEYTIKSRKHIINDWNEYLKSTNIFTPTEKFIIINAITKGLKPNEETLPPVLNKSVLSDAIENLREKLAQDKNYQFDFRKMYVQKLRKFYSVPKENHWVIIPSKQKDPQNYETNIEKLETLSHKSWCLKSYCADLYLKNGDIHIYYENGEPKLAIRFYKNTVVEIQGEKNDGKIPEKYLAELQRHVEQNSYLILDRIKENLK